jgi:superfamily II DNA or RNA helicase
MVNQKRRNLQNECVKALAGANYNACAILPTGVGKAWILIECLKRINPKGTVWYMCDSEENRDVTFKKQLKEWGASEWIDKIEYICYQSAYKLKGETGDVMLCDEFDYALSPKYVKGIINNNFKHKVLVSASLSAAKRAMAEGIAPIVYEKYLKEIEDDGLLNKAKHYYVNFLLSDKENEEYLRFNKRFTTLMEDTYLNKGRLEMLQIQRKHFMSSLETGRNICRKLIKKLYGEQSNKILIFCGLSEQADAICQYSYHSKSEFNYLPAFDSGKIRVLTVVSKADRGLNLNGVNCIIMESPTKSATKQTQRSGRGRRLHVDDMLHVFYLIPYYKTKYGAVQATIVKRWVEEATKGMNFEPIIYKL